MIKVNINRENNLIDNITIKGHARYDEYGKDIVCSSVSSIVITTVNALIRLNENYIEYQESNDLITIKLLKQDNTINILINNMINLLEELEKQYPKNITVNN